MWGIRTHQGAHPDEGGSPGGALRIAAVLEVREIASYLGAAPYGTGAPAQLHPYLTSSVYFLTSS